MRIQCPHCSAVLTSSKTLKPGASIGCPKCRQKFQLPRKSSSSRQRPKSKPIEDEFGFGAGADDDFEMDFPTPRRRSNSQRRKSSRKKQQAKKRKQLILWSSVGGGIAVLLIVLIIVLTSGKKEEKGEEFAQNDPPANTNPVSAPGINPNSKSETVPVSKSPGPLPQPKQPVPQKPKPQPVQIGDAFPAETPPPVSSRGDGQMNPAVLRKVKKATVMLKVTSHNNRQGSGSGFFTIQQDMIVTNAHVLGMLDPGTPKPRQVEVVIDSGEPSERIIPAKILAVDRKSDLALLSIKESGVKLDSLPPPLKVYSARNLLETQKVYVFGFPFGEELGKNITVSSSSISSLRKDTKGQLSQVQVNGGMNPGNSGGPVVDGNGNVIGVAVAIIEGTQINFAIPGDSVSKLLKGRISTVTLGEAGQDKTHTLLPVTVRTMDPMNKIRKLGITWWIGNKGNSRAPRTSPPPHLTGDSEHADVKLVHQSTTRAQGTLRIPEPGQGKTVYIQPMYELANGKKFWLQSIQYDPEPLVELTPVVLKLNQERGKTSVTMRSSTQVALSTYDGENYTSETEFLAQFDERIFSPVRNQRVLKKIDMKNVVLTSKYNGQLDKRTQLSSQLLRSIDMTLEEDGYGRLKRTKIPKSKSRKLSGLHYALMDQVYHTLYTLSIPFHNSLSPQKPGKKWGFGGYLRIDRKRTYSLLKVYNNYHFKGVGKHNGRRVAVISFTGGPENSSGTTKPLRGKAYYDLEWGIISHVQISLNSRMTLNLGKTKAKLSTTVSIQLDRTKK